MLRISQFSCGLCIAALALLSGCGGGGSGGSNTAGSGSNGNTPPPQNGLQITANKEELRFVGVGPSATAEEKITFTLVNAQASAKYYAVAEPDAKLAVDVIIAESNLNSITVGLRSRNAPASVDGAITFKLCKDEKCGDVAWSRAIPYRARSYSLDASEVRLSGIEGLSTSVTRAITPKPAAGDLQIVTDSYAPWLSAKIDEAGNLVVTGSGAAVPKGNYSGSLYVHPATRGAGSFALVNVSMSLGVGVALPADGSVTIGAKSPALINASVALGFNGNQSPAWTVSSDKPWLVPTTQQGTGAATVGYTVNSALLAGMANFASETGRLSFKVAGHPDAIYKVVVDKKLPEIQAVAPYQVAAGKPAEVRLRGRGLQQLGTVSAIHLDGSPLAIGTIISDTEAKVTVGSLAAGAHALAIPSAPGIAQPVLHAVNAPQLGAATIASVGVKQSLSYSATRNAMYTVDQTNAKLLRYRFIGGAWTNDKSVTVEKSSRLALSHDEKTLYTTNGGHTLEERDPDTLALTGSYVFNGPDPAVADYNGRPLPITNDGRIWLGIDLYSGLLYFDVKTKSFEIAELMHHPMGPSYAVSADGGRMFVHTTTSTTRRSFRYDVSTQKFSDLLNVEGMDSYEMVLSANGQYAVVNRTNVYETDTGRLVGRLPDESGGWNSPILMSPDGSRVYRPVTKTVNGMFTAVAGLEVYESSSARKIGEIAFPDGVAVCETLNDTTCNPYGKLTLTPFGDTIIWTGNKKIAIVPVPAKLGGMSGVRFKLVK